VRSVVDGCWGPCLPPTECSEVTDCESCGDAVCVMNSAIGTRACVAPPDGCSAGNYCECLHACPTTTGFECIESDGAVVCYCATC
jgi:hypothetical protein